MLLLSLPLMPFKIALYPNLKPKSIFNQSAAKMSDQVKSKEGEAIHVGDQVVTKIRGGKHEGKV